MSLDAMMAALARRLHATEDLLACGAINTLCQFDERDVPILTEYLESELAEGSIVLDHFRAMQAENENKGISKAQTDTREAS